jgi:hypothetical protein
MKFNKALQIAREESFNIERPDIAVKGISSDITVIESQDGKCHIKIFADSDKAMELAQLVEIVEAGNRLIVNITKKGRKFFDLTDGGLHRLSVELSLPTTSNLSVKTVSSDVDVNHSLTNLEITSVSGDVRISQNATENCIVKTVSGDIATHTFSTCTYTLKSISGDIKVSVAPDLNIDVDGNSISGDLKSEISLDSGENSLSTENKIVKITASTISGDFNLVRN